MSRPNNYELMAQSIRDLYRTYDQASIVANIPLTHDEDYFYLPILGRTCRVTRATGDIFWGSPNAPYLPTANPNDTMTIFDYLCDARPDRALTGQFGALAGFGSLFHTSLTESDHASPLELFCDSHPDRLHGACLAMGGTPHPRGDIGYVLPLFPDFPVLLQFYHSDEDFPPQLRTFWDGGSLSFLRYETMHYANGLILRRLSDLMDFHN